MHILSLDFQSNVYIVCAKCLHLHWHTKKKKRSHAVTGVGCVPESFSAPQINAY